MRHPKTINNSIRLLVVTSRICHGENQSQANNGQLLKNSVCSSSDQAVIAIENVRLFRELTEALEQQTATSEILGVIASSPTDTQPVLSVIAENAARICGTPDAAIFRVEDDAYRVVATYGSAPVQAAGETRPLDRGSVVGRAMVDRHTLHIHDIRAVQDDFWRVKKGAVQRVCGQCLPFRYCARTSQSVGS
jgi:hypothetical protein